MENSEAALVVKDDVQERAIDLQPAVVFDKSEPFELIHEDVHATSICSDDLRECLLRYLGNDFLRSPLFAIAGK